MAADLIRVTGTGRLTRDPYVNDKGTFLGIRLAYTTRSLEDGEWGDKSNFIDVNLIGQRAGTLEKYLHKGDRIGYDGKLEIEERDEGERARIIADDIFLLEPRKDDDGGSRKSSGSKRSTSSSRSTGRSTSRRSRDDEDDEGGEDWD